MNKRKFEEKVERCYTDYGESYLIIDDAKIFSLHKDERMLNYILEGLEEKKVRMTLEILDD